MVKFRLNPGGASPDNAIQISAENNCCNGEGKVCQYVLALAALGTVTSITTKDASGNTVTTTVSGVTNKKTLREALVKAVNASGGHLVDGGIIVTENGGAYNITVLGEVPFVSLENGSTRTFTANCTEAYECDVKFLIKYGTPTLTFNGTGTSLGTVASATTTSAIKTIVDTATSGTFTVTADVARGGFIAAGKIKSTDAIYVDGVAPFATDCYPKFTT